MNLLYIKYDNFQKFDVLLSEAIATEYSIRYAVLEMNPGKGASINRLRQAGAPPPSVSASQIPAIFSNPLLHKCHDFQLGLHWIQCCRLSLRRTRQPSFYF